MRRVEIHDNSETKPEDRQAAQDAQDASALEHEDPVRPPKLSFPGHKGDTA